MGTALENWFALPAVRKTTLEEVISEYRSAYGEPDPQSDSGPCVFYHVDSSQGLVNVLLYFSPTASALAERCGAVVCANPSKHGLHLLIGGKNCKHLTHPLAPSTDKSPRDYLRGS